MKTIDKSNIILAVEQEKMSSLDVAELVGMRHDNLLRDIRKMQKAWESIAQSSENEYELKFEETLINVNTSNGSTRTIPVFNLTQTQWLYVATKFNDVARAKLVLRWKQLEKERLATKMEREISKIARRTFTDALQESGENERMHGFAYSTYTNKIYKALFNMNAKQLREYLNLPKGENIKDKLPQLAVKRILALEGVAQHLLEMGCTYDDICEQIDSLANKQNIGMNLKMIA